MRFDVYLPCDILKPFIKYLAISENSDEQSYKVLPDTGVVIGFQYRGNLSVVNSGNITPLASSGLTGINDTYRIFKNSADIGTVLVFFRAAGAAVFFSQPIHELFRESISLDNFMLQSELLILEERLYEANTDLIRIAIVEQFLIGRMLPLPADQLVLKALSIISKYKGNIRISELASQLNISQSPLEKRFRKAVGASPKKLASIVRFKNILLANQHDGTDTLTSLAYRAGFYDQAHFIKGFRNFTGESPEAFFRPSS